VEAFDIYMYVVLISTMTREPIGNSEQRS